MRIANTLGGYMEEAELNELDMIQERIQLGENLSMAILLVEYALRMAAENQVNTQRIAAIITMADVIYAQICMKPEFLNREGFTEGCGNVFDALTLLKMHTPTLQRFIY